MVHLRYLNVSGCRLKHLPKSICRLKNLQTLNLQNCDNLQKLPKSINKLVNLRYLNLSGCCKLIQLPDGVGELINLRHLNLSECSELIQLPDGVGELINLRHLDLSKCSELTHLPQLIGKLISLTHLDLNGCYRLRQMPIGISKLICLEILGWFIVGREDRGCSIRELHGLNHLRGHLEIRGLEHVRNGAESEQANLGSKKNLSSLNLIWLNVSSNSEDVMQGLQPCHENLQKLSIYHYGGSVFPSWMKLLVNLVEIGLLDCSKCEDLPPLGHLPLLKTLDISGMDSLKRINKEFYGISSSSEASNGFFFPSLEILTFGWMPNWEEWESPSDQQRVFPSLKELQLSGCPSLASLPFSIQHSLQKLVVRGNCEKLMVRSLPCVRVLELVGDSFLGSLQYLDALQSLRLRDCEFPCIPQPLENLSSLKYLQISSCSFLTSLSHPLQHLSFLPTLIIRDCSELEFSSADFHQLLSLKILNLLGLPKLVSLPNLQHLLSIECLNIQGCQNLEGLLPQWIQNLTSLDKLIIRGCHPDLESKCKKDNGEYWPFISHIRYLEISSSLERNRYFWLGEIPPL